MEEKERYKWSQDAIVECPYEDYDYIVDTENNIIFDDDNYFKLVDLLNQQSKRIKELEEENNFLKKRNEKLIIDRRDICLERNDIFEENQQLKQQLAITEKALELACEPRDDWGGEKYSRTEYDNYYDYFMAEAKEMLENE